MEKTIILIGFSTTGKSSLIRKIKKVKGENSILTLDTDEEISKSYGGSISDIFYKFRRDNALNIIKSAENDFLRNYRPSHSKPTIIAAGPSIPCREDYEGFIGRIQPEIIYLHKNSAEEIYKSFLERIETMKMKDKDKHNNPKFGIWDIGVMTDFQNGKIIQISKEKAIENIEKLLRQNEQYYTRYPSQKIATELVFEKDDELPLEIEKILSKVMSG